MPGFFLAGGCANLSGVLFLSAAPVPDLENKDECGSDFLQVVINSVAVVQIEETQGIKVYAARCAYYLKVNRKTPSSKHQWGCKICNSKSDVISIVMLTYR